MLLLFWSSSALSTASASITLSLAPVARVTAFAIAALPSAFSVTDSFDRADDAVSLGVADTGQAWSALSGTWGISGSQAYLPVAAGSAQAVVESGHADAVIQATLTAFGQSGLLIRARNLNNTLVLRINRGVGTCALRSIVGGVETTLQNVVVALPLTMVVRVECEGTTIRAFVDGTQRIAVAGVTDFQTETKHGLYASAAQATTWDAFSITGIPAPHAIVLALNAQASQGFGATAQPSIRLALAAHAIGGTDAAGGSVVDLEYNASGTTLTNSQVLTFHESGVSTLTLKQTE